MVFSEPMGKMRKVIMPGALEFMMHAEAEPGAEEFARGAICTYKEVWKWSNFFLPYDKII